MRTRNLVLAAVAAFAGLIALAYWLGGASPGTPPAAEPPEADAPQAREEVPLPPAGSPAAGRPVRVEPRPGAPTDPHRGTISGCVRGPDGKGLEAAEVRARPEASTDRAPPALARTDAEGRYLLAALAPGVFAVEARASGLRPEQASGVVVEAGEAVVDLDFLLDAGARLEGTVVEAATGRPIRGASVRAHAPEALSGRVLTRSREVRDPERPSEQTATTGEDGRFRLQGLGTGLRLVSAKASGYRTSEVLEVEVRDGVLPPIELRLEGGAFIAGKVSGPDGAPAAGVRVTAEPEGMGPFGGGQGEGGEASTDSDGRYRVEGLGGTRFRVTAWPEGGLAPASRGRIPPNREDVDLQLAAGASIAGLVLAAESKEPIAGAAVDVGMPGLRRTTTTAGDGSFAFEGLPAMGLELRASHGKRAPHEERLDLKAGEARAGLVIELSAGGRVVGQVLTADTRTPLAGAVVFAAGDEGAQGGGGRRGRGGPGGGGAGQQLFLVESMASGGDRSGALPDAMMQEIAGRLVHTDSQGRFEIGNLPVGPVTVMAAHASHPGATVRATIPDAGGEAEVTLLLPAGGRIEGFVRGEDGRPVEHAVVFAFAFTGRARSAESDAQGAYAIEGLFPGSYFASLGGFPGGSAQDGASGFRSQTANVEQGKATRVDFGAEAQARVSGQVTRGGLPVADNGMQVLSRGGDLTFRPTQTDADGRFELRLPAGAYLVQIGSYSKPFDVAPRATEVQLDVALPEASASGRVVDAVTQAPLTAEVTLYKAERSERADTFAAAIGASAGSSRANPDGAFRVGGLEPGPYTLVVRADGYAEARLEVDVPAGELTGIEVALEPGGVLRGLVRGPDGAPVAATLWVVDIDAADLPSGQPPRSGEDGAFELRRFAPGRYVFTALTETLAPWRRVIDFPGGELDVGVDLVEGGSLDLLVTRAGVPVPGALVELRYPDGERVINGFADFIASAQPTGPDGRFRRVRLPPGTLLGSVSPAAAPGGPPPEPGAAAGFQVTIADRGEAQVVVELP